MATEMTPEQSCRDLVTYYERKAVEHAERAEYCREQAALYKRRAEREAARSHGQSQSQDSK